MKHFGTNVVWNGAPKVVPNDGADFRGLASLLWWQRLLCG